MTLPGIPAIHSKRGQIQMMLPKSIATLLAVALLLVASGAGAKASVIPASMLGGVGVNPIRRAPYFFALQGKPIRAPLEVELITITPAGFEPKEISRLKGPFLLAVENRSGLEDVLLRLDRATGGDRLKEVRVNRKKLDWRDQVDLTPGHYVLMEANHPGWTCGITITPN